MASVLGLWLSWVFLQWYSFLIFPPLISLFSCHIPNLFSRSPDPCGIEWDRKAERGWTERSSLPPTGIILWWLFPLDWRALVWRRPLGIFHNGYSLPPPTQPGEDLSQVFIVKIGQRVSGGKSQGMRGNPPKTMGSRSVSHH